MEALVAFAAALLAFRLAGRLAGRYRSSGRPELLAWAAGLGAYAIAAGAIAWGEAAGWDDRAFRVYYAAGGLLTAPLLGAGSLLLAGRRRAAPTAIPIALPAAPRPASPLPVAAAVMPATIKPFPSGRCRNERRATTITASVPAMFATTASRRAGRKAR